MLSKAKIIEQLDVYEKHVKEYEESFRSKNKLPKNHDWRSYRWCSRDIVFSLMTVRHGRFRNCLEVDVCLIANPIQYPDNTGARVAMGFLLSEAYKCGTSMEIVFTENVESRVEDGQKKGRVPAYIYDLACELNIKLKHVLEGHITPFEARQMYMELTGFSQQAKEKIMEMAVAGLISPERACFMVLGGVWSVPEAEALILGCDGSESILLSKTEPEDRHLYLRDVLNSRGAILGGALDRKIRKKELVEDGQIVESEDIETEVEVAFDGPHFAKVYDFFEDVEIPWTGESGISLSSGERAVVLVRSRSSVETQALFSEDLKAAEAVIKKYRAGDSPVKVSLLYPRDFEDIPVDEKTRMKAELVKLGVSLMVSPECVSGLEKEAVRRIETGRMVRHE